MNKNLAQWLSYIESLHPKNIEMGLSRINQMIEVLQLKPSFKLIVVAGTNGKGSTSAILESIYCQAGYEVGCYSSPHLLRYNERLRINQLELPDDAFCDAFSVIESARVKVGLELTYFEFGTLAAVYCLMQHAIDVAILEIGLGGRLDAVNAFDADCAIVTNIALDHQDYLGDTRELIGAEKAGVYRPNTPAICGDQNPPKSLTTYAQSIGANFKAINVDFSLTLHQDDCCLYQLGSGDKQISYRLPALALVGDFQKHNAACALTAVESLKHALPVTVADIASAFESVKISGRFEKVEISIAHMAKASVIFDVAHNPHAAEALALSLARNVKGPVSAVFSMLLDKDITAVVLSLKDVIDEWHIGEIDHVRGASPAQMKAVLLKIIPDANVKYYKDVTLAFKGAINASQSYKAHDENVSILVFGSFFTVAAVKQYLTKNEL